MATTDKGPTLPDGLDPSDYFLVKGKYVDCNGVSADKAAADAAGKSEAEQVAAQAAAELADKDDQIAALQAQVKAAGAPAQASS